MGPIAFHVCLYRVFGLLWVCSRLIKGLIRGFMRPVESIWGLLRLAALIGLIKGFGFRV